MGRYENKLHKNDIPGPGQYEMIQERGKQAVIGNSERRPLNEHGTDLGPGQYETPSLLFDNAPKFSIRNKSKSINSKL
jgi:hypothetical protein